MLYSESISVLNYKHGQTEQEKLRESIRALTTHIVNNKVFPFKRIRRFASLPCTKYEMSNDTNMELAKKTSISIVYFHPGFEHHTWPLTNIH